MTLGIEKYVLEGGNRGSPWGEYYGDREQSQNDYDGSAELEGLGVKSQSTSSLDISFQIESYLGRPT